MSNKRPYTSPYAPCKPEEFAGRFNEKVKSLDIVSKAKERGQVILVTGARGAGKSSFLDWIVYKLQEEGELEIPAIKNDFLETPGMIFTAYKDMLTGIKGHTRFGWLSTAINNPTVQKSMGAVLGILDKVSSLAGPGKIGADAGVAALGKLMPGGAYDHSQLLTELLKILNGLSVELAKGGHTLALLLDDAQWASGPDFHLLKDIVRNVPQGIVLIASFRLENKSMEKHVALSQELDRYGHTEIRIGGMSPDEIKDFSGKRYGITIDDKTADFLSRNIGDPFTLVGCFNLLKEKGLEPAIASFREILPETVDAAKCVYTGLDDEWKKRAGTLCILHPPLNLTLIACLLGTKESELLSLKEEFDNSVIFKELAKETYDFAHPSLREYCRKEMPESMKPGLHLKAAECLKPIADEEPGPAHALAYAEHLFSGGDYEKSLKLNLLLGAQLHKLFDYDTALLLTERAITCAEKTGDKWHLGAATHQKGRILQDAFKYDAALDAYKTSLEIAHEIGTRQGEAATLHQIGMVYQEKNSFDEALKYYAQSLEIKRGTGDRSSEAITLHQIGIVYQYKNSFDEALKYYTQSLEIARETGNRADEAATLHQIGMVYQYKNSFDEALKYYTQSLEIARATGDRAGEATTLHQIGIVYELKNELDEALEYYTQSLDIARETGDRAGEAMTLHQIGMVYQYKNSLDEALKYYTQSLEIVRETGNRSGEAKSLHQIGMVYQYKNSLDEALKYYTQSLEIKRETGNRSGQAATLHQIGRVCQEKNEPDEALKYYKQSLEIARETGNKAGEANSLHQIGRVYEDKNSLDEALKYYTQSLEIERETGNKAGEEISLKTIEALKDKLS